jgi:hypothetical protein
MRNQILLAIAIVTWASSLWIFYGQINDLKGYQSKLEQIVSKLSKEKSELTLQRNKLRIKKECALCGVQPVFYFPMSNESSVELFQRYTVEEGQMRERLARMKINLITSFFIKQNDTLSNQEMEMCLQTNLNNPYIKKIHLLQDGTYNFTGFINNEKIVATDIHSRITVKDAIRYANAFLQGEVSIISNSDIYYDDTIKNLLLLYESQDITRSYAISRRRTYRRLPDGELSPKTDGNDKDHCELYQGSHDAFIFISPLPEELADELPIFLGMPGLDNRIIYQFRTNGIHVTNPCRVIKIWHVHSNRSAEKLPKRVDMGGLSAISEPTYDL